MRRPRYIYLILSRTKGERSWTVDEFDVILSKRTADQRAHDYREKFGPRRTDGQPPRHYKVQRYVPLA